MPPSSNTTNPIIALGLEINSFDPLTIEWYRILILVFCFSSFISIFCNIGVLTLVFVYNHPRNVFIPKNLRFRPSSYMTFFLIILETLLYCLNLFTLLSLSDVLSSNLVICDIQGYSTAFLRMFQMTAMLFFAFQFWRSITNSYKKDPYSNHSYTFKFMFPFAVFFTALPSITLNYGYAGFGWSEEKRRNYYYRREWKKKTKQNSYIKKKVLD